MLLSYGQKAGLQPLTFVHRPLHPLHRLRSHRICSRAAEQYGAHQTATTTRTDARSEDAGPAISLSGSESDSESEDGIPVLEAKAKHEGAPNALGPLAGLGSIVGIALLLGAGFFLKDAIKDFLVFFIDAVESWGPMGYLAYAAVYTGLEVLAVPAIPLTMTAGIIFGPVPGTIVTSISGTAAATIAFLIARYAARDRVLRWARRNNKFAAIDRAIARNGFKFVTLLRLSPLFPLAVSNYLYGLTSVDLWSYVAGSWIGMLPGTYAYVSAGHLGKAALMDGEGSLGVESWQVALGFGMTLLAIGYVGRLAKTAIEEAEAGSGSDLEDEPPVRTGTGPASGSAASAKSTDPVRGSISSNGRSSASNGGSSASNGGSSASNGGSSSSNGGSSSSNGGSSSSNGGSAGKAR